MLEIMELDVQLARWKAYVHEAHAGHSRHDRLRLLFFGEALGVQKRAREHDAHYSRALRRGKSGVRHDVGACVAKGGGVRRKRQRVDVVPSTYGK